MPRFFSKRVWNDQKNCFEPALWEVRSGRFEILKWGKPAQGDLRGRLKDYEGFYVGPSGIDLHLHGRDFEESHKETLESLAHAAEVGGVCAGACMANTRPAMDNVKQVNQFLQKAKLLRIDLRPFAAVTKELKGKEDTDWDALLKLPIVGLSDDGKPILDAKRMERVLKKTKQKKKLLSLHEENTEVSKGSLLHEGSTSVRLGVAGSPAEAESSMVARDLALAKRIKAPIHLCHVSAAETLSLIRRYQRQGVAVSAELTPHHALLTVDPIEKEDPVSWSQWKVCPVIRSREDQKELQKGFREGVLDCFATDHAPHSSLEKENSIQGAPHGIISLEYAFALYHEVKIKASASWSRFFRAWAQRPAELFGEGKSKGRIQSGYEASWIVFDPHCAQEVEFEVSKSRNAPWKGYRLSASLNEHWVGGRQVFSRF